MGQRAKSKPTRRCHWVPQGYLRKFAADPDRDRIWRLSKNEGDPELKLIEKVAVRHHLYVTRDGRTGKRDDTFEKKLSELENWFGHPVWDTMATSFVDLSWEPLRKMVSLLAAVMYLRNPLQLRLATQMHANFKEACTRHPTLPVAFEINGKRYPLDPASWPAFHDATAEDIKRDWISEVGRAAWLAEIFMAMRWSVIVADAPVFITSDNPVFRVHPSLRDQGFHDPETAVIFPLSPTRLLNFDNRSSEPANQYYPLKGDGSSMNLLIWRWAKEHMFSHRDCTLVCSEIAAEAEREGFVQAPSVRNAAA
jgi:hypothetical protein